MKTAKKIIFALILTCMGSNGQAAVRLKCLETARPSSQSIFLTASAKSFYFDIGDKKIASNVAKQLDVEFPEIFIGVKADHHDIPCSVSSDYATFADFTCETKVQKWSTNAFLRDREGYTVDILWHMTKAYLHVTYDGSSGLSIETEIADPDRSFKITQRFANKYRCEVSNGAY